MLPVLDPQRPFEPFPNVESALDEPNGLLAAGGCLSPARLINAYRHGIFPWFNDDEPILWWSPDPRWVMAPDAVRVSRSLGKRLRRGEFSFSHDRAFARVIKACSEPREGTGGTWITAGMRSAYLRLHQLGFAHSFETWRNGQLAGGLYGVAIGRVFFGESMFHRTTDASKAAFVLGCNRLQEWGFRLIDCQVHTRHLESLGARAMPRAELVCRLREWCQLPAARQAWRVDPC